MLMPIYIVCFGGFAKETYWYAKELEVLLEVKVMGFVDKVKTHDYYDGVPIFNENVFNYNNKNIVIATGDPQLRKKIYEKIISNAINVNFPNIISPSATVRAKQTFTLGKGIIIAAGCVLVCDITLDDFVNLNLNTTVGHDSILKKFATTATNVSISGNVILGECAYLGNNSCVKEKCVVCDDAIIGMGGVVTKNITEPGTYVGIPAKRIK